MRRRLVLLLAVSALVAVSAAPVGARGHQGNGPENFRTHLTGDAEVPSVETKAQGQAIFQLRNGELHYKLIVANIENVTQAHIHLGSAGTNGGVVAFLYGFDLIEGRFQGVLAEGTISSTDVIGSLAGDLDALLDAMRSGNTYVNVHTTQNPGGEVRGQIH